MTRDPVEVTRQAYDAIARRYRERWHRVDPLVDAKRVLMDQVPAGARILDVGCGTGRDAEWLADRGCHVLGLDASLGMLRLASGPVARINADMRRLPLRDASVDGWWAAASLLHLDRPDARTALRELHRVTRAGGSGFVSVKEGEGQGYRPADDHGHERFFCLWDAGGLDTALAAAGWAIAEAWTAADTLGREPWLCRLVTRMP